jgi:hypothetical protein
LLDVFVNRVPKVHNDFTLRRQHTLHMVSYFCHAKQSKQLLIHVRSSAGFHKSYTLPTTLGVYQPNHHRLTTLNLEGSGYEFGILSFGCSTTSSVHCITRALAMALRVPSFGGHNDCIPRRQTSKSTPASRVDFNGRNLKSAQVAQVDFNGCT